MYRRADLAGLKASRPGRADRQLHFSRRSAIPARGTERQLVRLRPGRVEPLIGEHMART